MYNLSDNQLVTSPKQQLDVCIITHVQAWVWFVASDRSRDASHCFWFRNIVWCLLWSNNLATPDEQIALHFTANYVEPYSFNEHFRCTLNYLFCVNKFHLTTGLRVYTGLEILFSMMYRFFGWIKKCVLSVSLWIRWISFTGFLRENQQTNVKEAWVCITLSIRWKEQSSRN